MKQFANLLLLLFLNPFCETKYDSLRKSLAMEALLDNPNKSQVVSTLLVRFPLCKLAAHAQGNSKIELLSILGITRDTALQSCYTNFTEVMAASKATDLMILNQIIVNYTDYIRPTFLSNSTNYGVKADKVGFDYPKLAVSFLNRWIERASLKRLSEVLDMKDINNKTSILIISAAYFKITWEFPFDMRLTKNMKFYHHDGNVSAVEMMKRTDFYLHLDDTVTNTLYVNLKLASLGLSLTIAVPSIPYDLTRLVHTLSSNPDALKGVYGRMRPEVVNVMLPRFKIKTLIDWNKCLQKIGLERVFNETNSDLNGILTKNSPLKYMYLSKVKQKNFIDVDEMGIFRYAVNDDTFGDPHPRNEHSGLSIIADHPFLFFVNLQTDMTNPLDLHELFTGVYYGPGY